MPGSHFPFESDAGRPADAESGIPRMNPVIETIRIRRRLEREAPNEFAAIRRYDGRKRATELAMFVALAAAGFWVSIHARSVASTLMLILGIIVTAVAMMPRI